MTSRKLKVEPASRSENRTLPPGLRRDSALAPPFAGRVGREGPASLDSIVDLQRRAGNAAIAGWLQSQHSLEALTVQRVPKVVEIASELPYTDIADAHQQAEALYKKARKLYELPEKMKKAAAALGKIKGARAKDMPVIASSLLSAADSVVNIAAVYDAFTGQLKSADVPVSEISSRISKANKALKVLGALAALVDDSALQEFVDNPTPDTAYTWAEDTTDVFTRVAAVVPDDLVFVSPMLKGLLSAPANYLHAFKTILDAHIHKIDQAAGITASKEKVMEGEQTVWQGKLSLPYHEAWPDGLREFMKAHKKADGIDLYETTRAFGIAHLLNLIHQEAPDRTDWVENLSRWL